MIIVACRYIVVYKIIKSRKKLKCMKKSYRIARNKHTQAEQRYLSPAVASPPPTHRCIILVEVIIYCVRHIKSMGPAIINNILRKTTG